ncbi:phage tail protein [Pseudomonas sp. ANT_J28]|uniref:phage tail-collar fiber domain-containing protein n=1 Tax=Pseudomonas sp. ANT_J28 TaxID=2597352 RepID=UPI0011F33BCC|nr:phage tail protein [Pseudomonas sp. ANT_J28]KAA0983767.1 phage tail protein [Pseudomonas sp. ANT_J28]
MSASITLVGESQIAFKHAHKVPLIISKFIFANVPGLDPLAPIDRTAAKPPAGQIVHVYNIPKENAGFVNPNQVVYSAQLGSDIGDWDFNWIGLEDEDGGLFAVSYVPLQQKRKNIPPLQIGNNLTRNFLVAFDGAMQLTGVKIDASTWQHDFTVRLAGIDERERLSNRDLYGRSCFFGDAFQVVKVGNAFQLKPGLAYVEGIRLELASVFPIELPKLPSPIYLHVSLRRELNDVVSSWTLGFEANQVDYTDSAGTRHYCIALADVTSSTMIDYRTTEPITRPLIQHLAARTGDYKGLRARATTKEDVGLGELPNAKSDDPKTNSSEILATTAALNQLNQQTNEAIVGMVSAFAIIWAPPGWLKCNGAAISRTTFASLFARLGTLYGAGDGSTTFNLPDLRGLFPRAWDDGRGIDVGRGLGTYQEMLLHSHAHTATSTAAGDHQHAAWTDAQGAHQHNAWADSQGEHAHTVKEGAISPSGPGGEVLSSGDDYTTAINNYSSTGLSGAHSHNIGMGTAGGHSHNVGISTAGGHSHAITIAAAGGAETRPKNMALLFCIKY